MRRFFFALLLLAAPSLLQAQFVNGNFEPVQIKGKVATFESQLAAYTHNINLMGNTRSPVSVNAKNCGSDGAYYTPSQNEIVFCNELIINILNDFVFSNPNRQLGADEAHGAITFIAFHEAAHVFIDQYNLPIAGREEDVADQIATFLLLEAFLGKNHRSESYYITGPIKFFMYRLSQPTIGAFADEHSLNQQRIINIACWSYGFDPVAFAPLVQPNLISVHRARKCEKEFKQIKNFMFSIYIPSVTGNGVRW